MSFELSRSFSVDHLSVANDHARSANKDGFQWPNYQEIQLALEHLYDYVYLQGHSLAPLIQSGAAGWNRGAMLHRLLLETIERLKPPPETPPHSPLWRRYRHAFMRYVEAKTVSEIAEELGVSDRQARRDNHDAVVAIAELLRERFHGHQRSSMGIGERSRDSGTIRGTER